MECSQCTRGASRAASGPVWTGTVALALLTPYNDPAVHLAGAVGALVPSLQSRLPTAERRSLEAIDRSWAATTWFSFDLCPHCDLPRLRRAVQITPLVAPDTASLSFRVCGALPKGSTVTRVMAVCGQLLQGGRPWGPAVSLTLGARQPRPWST